MKMRRNRRKLWALIIFPCCVLLILAVLLSRELHVSVSEILHKEAEPSGTGAASAASADISGMLSEVEAYAAETKAETETDSGTEEASDGFYATSHKIQEPLTENSIELADVYAMSGAEVKLKCYYPEAVSYSWEKYDMQDNEWEALDNENVTDELYREISTVTVTVPDSQSDAVMVRCTVKPESGEDITDTASVYPISGITGISVSDAYVTGCSEWLPSMEVPVQVDFEDGTTEKIIGLNGLVFVDRLESSEITYSDTGNIIETVTTVNTECEYSYVEAGEKELVLRYRDNDRIFDTAFIVTGKDMEAPVISNVSLSDFAISNVDEPVTVEVSITAEDNETPYPKLVYAFLPQGTEPQEADWTTKGSFEKDIGKNGIWIAYCKDQSGNIATYEKKIIAVDQKAPNLKLALANTQWCQSNKILADADDELAVTYLFTCPETGEDSGWTDRNEYEVSRNGTWQVQAKDAAGNVAVKDIKVSNIDTQMPVIKQITETGGETLEN